MNRERSSWAGIGWGGILLGIGLITIQARLLGTAILDLAFRLPPDPIAFLGNVLIFGSALILICSRLKPCQEG